MTVAAYVRVSSKAQDVAMQRAAIERYAAARGDVVDRWYVWGWLGFAAGLFVGYALALVQHARAERRRRRESLSFRIRR